MSETRSAKQNNNLNGELTLKNLITSNHLRYLTNDSKGLTIDAVTDAEVVATNHSLIANTLATSDFDGDADGELTLPAATPDTVVIYEQGETLDSAKYLKFKCAGDDVFEAGCHIVLGTNATNQSDTSVATDTSLKLTMTATNNPWGGVGSQICFYCATAGSWRVKLGTRTIVGSGVVGAQVLFA